MTIPASYLTAFSAKFENASATDAQTVFNYFIAEAKGSEGLAADATFTLDEAALKSKWDSFIAGGDPFGFHTIGVTIATVIANESADRLEIIWTLFSKLIELLQAIQKSAIALSEGVSYKTKTQSAITDEISTIDPSASDFPSSTDVQKEQKRDEQVRRQQKIENLGALRTSERDDSKQWSSSVSAANDATQGQTQILTSIMQQMSGLITAIFR